jgi:DNA-binding transcriptional ArsR family regulator
MLLFAMRPLFHPSLEDVTVAGILHALADPVRVAIYARIAGADCKQTCSAFLEISERTIPKSTLSQHFKILREAGLIRGERHGVEMHNTSRCAEINQRFPGLLPAILSAHAQESKATTRPASGPKRKSAPKA